MSLRDWWDAVKDLFDDKPKPEPEKRRPDPPHSWPTDKPLPPWPEKKK